MERKIGEIFEYNGEWYQCIKNDSCCCDYCDFSELGDCDNIACASGERNDNKEVHFKRLEKVGEPYELNSHLVQKYRFFHNPAIQVNGICILETINTDKIIEIGIKQAKKDMEDLDKIKVRDYTKVEELNVMEENKLNLKPFDIQKAREGKPVCTRDGRKARIIAFDRRLFYKNVSYPILALVERSDGEDDVCGYNEKGKVLIEDGAEYKDDLMMLPEKKEGWVNVYKIGARLETGGDVHSTKDAAIKCIDSDKKHIATVKINWEE